MDLLVEYFTQLEWEDIIFSGLRILLILIVVWVGLRVVRTALDKLHGRLATQERAEDQIQAGEMAKRADTLVRLLRQGLYIIIWVMAALIILRELGVDIAPILASAGIVGLAVGFGAQNLVRDIIAGFFIILENQARVGDVAIINGEAGIIEAINFRTTILRDLSGTVHIFSNGGINSLSNMTRDWSAYLLDMGVAYKEDTDHVIEVMKRVAAELQQDEHFGPLILNELEVFGVNEFADSAVVIRVRLRTRPIHQWEVGREYLRRIKKAFDAEGIEIPFPHRSVYFGEASRPVAMQLSDDRVQVKPVKDTAEQAD
jgi:moderate conductance mechanosensitive channel